MKTLKPFLTFTLALLSMTSIYCVALYLMLFSSVAISSQPESAEIQVKRVKIELIADIDYRPYSYQENGKAKGLLIDIVHQVAAKLPQYELSITSAKWSDGKASVRKGEYVGLIGTYFNAHNWPLIYPYSYPILYETLVTVCSTDFTSKHAQARWPEDYAGLKIGTVAAYDGWLDESIKTREVDTVNFFEFPNASLALLGVYNDIVDCTLFEKVSFVETSKQLLADGKIRDLNKLSIGSVLSQNSLHIGYSEKIMRASSLTDKAANPYQFQKAFDAELFIMLQSGELAPIFLKYGTQYR